MGLVPARRATAHTPAFVAEGDLRAALLADPEIELGPNYDAPGWMVGNCAVRPFAHPGTLALSPSGKATCARGCDQFTLRRVALADPEERDRLRAEYAAVPVEAPLEHEPEVAQAQAAATVVLVDAPLTDTGNAERLVAAFGADLRYVPAWKTWFVWTGKRWSRDDLGTVREKAKHVARQILLHAASIEDDDRRKKIAAWGASSQSAGRIRAMVELAQTIPDVTATPADFDRDPWAFNVENGTIDLRTGVLRPHERADLITKISDVAYDDEAPCPTFVRFLDRVMGSNGDLVAFLRRAAGYSLTGHTAERVVFFLSGIGRNGKSTLLEALRHVLGDYGMTAPVTTLMAKEKGAATNDVARLQGARFVSASEAEDGHRLATAVVKAMTGNDTIAARFLYGEFFEFRPEFKIWFATNHKPQVSATDQAIWDRLRLIPFDVRIPESEVDPDLPAKLRTEAAGILAWAVRGCVEWQTCGLGTPPEVQQATDAYRGEMDTIGEFLSERCVQGDEVKVKVADLYAVYADWCRQNAEAPLPPKGFKDAMKRHGFDKRTSTGGFVYWFGVGLAAPVEELTSVDLPAGTPSRKDSLGEVSGNTSTHVNSSTLAMAKAMERFK